MKHRLQAAHFGMEWERNMLRMIGLSLLALLLNACDNGTPQGGAQQDAGDMMFQIDNKRPDEHEKTG